MYLAQASKFSKRMLTYNNPLKQSFLIQTRRLAGDTKKLSDKEKGDERVYFTKHDCKIIN